jgi:hypothetical protein
MTGGRRTPEAGTAPAVGPVRATLYDWVDEGGVGGDRQTVALWEHQGRRWIRPLDADHDADPPPGVDPVAEGWVPFVGVVVAPAVLARAWRACVQAPDTWWWDPPPQA